MLTDTLIVKQSYFYRAAPIGDVSSLSFYKGDRNSEVLKPLGTTYFWEIKDPLGKLNTPPSVKFFGPDQTETYILMAKVGSSWQLTKSLIKSGRYYWRYTLGKENLTAWNSYIDNVLLKEGDDYPYQQGLCIKNQKNCVDQWGFYMYNCTSWVAHCINKMWGTKRAFYNKMAGDTKGFGNAKDWKSRAIELGYQVNSIPKLGAVAYWPGYYRSNKTRIGVNGHVAIVSHVYSDGRIAIEEYNGTIDGKYSRRVISPSDDWYPESFLHMQYNYSLYK